MSSSTGDRVLVTFVIYSELVGYPDRYKSGALSVRCSYYYFVILFIRSYWKVADFCLFIYLGRVEHNIGKFPSVTVL